MFKAIKPARSRGASRGYLLLEVLVSLVLIAIGVLGMAGLQTVGITMNNSSLLRSKAALLANEMAERVRANLAGASAPVNAYNALTGSPSSPGCIGSGCNSSQVAQNDYYEWSNELSSELPGGVGVVCLTSTPASGRFGVITRASGTRRSRIAATASSRSSLSPLLATITGSSTRLRAA